MQNLFEDVAFLDKRCYEAFGLSEDLLMEHAADGMADFIRGKFPKKSSLLIVTGSGNNGADGIALGRMLHKEYDVTLYLAKEPKSPMCRLQLERAKKVGLQPAKRLGEEFDIVVDAVLGTGFSGVFNDSLRDLMQRLNALPSYKIACDVPSGLRRSGECETDTFIADTTLTMGALKRGMYLDEAKDFIGEVRRIELGVAQEVYETKSNWQLLEFSDMKLPFRHKQNTHKGSFGHTAVIAGEKSGAAILAALSALRIGSALVSVVDCQNIHVPHDLLHSQHLPKNTTAIALGMGLGEVWSEEEFDEFVENDIPTVVDADLFHSKRIEKLLGKKSLVLTPHPKEFSSLLSRLGIADVDVATLQKKRFEYAELFCKKYPNAVLVLKGANVIIAQDDAFFINPYGSSKLAKGGSGDVLGGLIAGLLAQGYTPLEAAMSASLAHTKLALAYKGANFSLTPSDLVATIASLSETP